MAGLALRGARAAMLVAALAMAASAAAAGYEALGDGMLLLRGAASDADIARVEEAERRAWADPFLSERQLVNQTRIITGSSAVQSVTWLHRNGKNDSSGALERLQEAALAAQSAAGWGLAPGDNEVSAGRSLHVRCIESIRYSVSEEDTAQGKHQRDAGGDSDVEGQAAVQRGRDEEGWHMDEWSVMTAVVVLSTSPDLRGGAFEIDRGSGPVTTELQTGDMLVFRSWDAHRSQPVLQGERHILVIELWQGPETPPNATAGRPGELDDGRATLCEPAMRADASSAALLWFCSKAADEHSAWRLEQAAQLVGGSAFLWEMAASAQAMKLLDELEHANIDDTAVYSSSLAPVVASLRHAGELRTAALVPNKTAEMPMEWEEDEDGVWQPPLIDGGDAANAGGFFQQMSRTNACGFPSEGLDLLRRMLHARRVPSEELREVVAGHPALDDIWDELDDQYRQEAAAWKLRNSCSED